ncbi:MAG: TonB-dependent receptor [Verrucomicrobiaceae bacterium]|nr:TonB-dependent receptor [Verrucomicrobiaceae bacterium]
MRSPLITALLLALPVLGNAQSAAPTSPSAAVSKPADTSSAASSTELETVTVYAEAEDQALIQNPFPPAVEGTKIFAGKRATVLDFDALPKVQANNYRQALAQTAGLLFSEETTPLVSIGYRGIGEPHRFQFMQVLKDGIPIHADQFGYPEAYYTPPLDVVDRIEFIRGGGSLMFGPQPGGAFNYVTYMPNKEKPFSFRTQNIYGTDNLFSSYTAADGTIGNLGYYGYFNHRSSDGFRESNSDYRLDGANLKLSYDFNPDTQLILSFDGYEEEHGEPGGLTFKDFLNNPDKVTRPNDRFRLKRYIGSAELKHKFNEGTELSVKSWGGYYQRWSRRQNGGGFGTLPEGEDAATNGIENQEFYTFGIEPRLRHDWQAWGATHTLSAGMQFYYADSPRVEREGSHPKAEEGALRLDAQRETLYGSFFAENKFTFNRWTITPGFRMELIRQSVDSTKVGDDGKTFLSKEVNEFQPLFGIGAEYQLSNDTNFYGNLSQSYRTTIFTESIVAQPGTSAVDTAPSTGWNYEIGWRGKPKSWFTFDTSVFLIDLDNRFGVTDDVLKSVGRSINYGLDVSFEADLLRAFTGKERESVLSFYGNATFLEAKLHGGPNDGERPQYAPDLMVRSGLIYRLGDKVKVGFLGTYVADHNARDDGDPQYTIPSYLTFDLTAEYSVTKNLTLMAGLNNVFDEKYFARVRKDGIDPAYGRNFYIGGMIKF